MEAISYTLHCFEKENQEAVDGAWFIGRSSLMQTGVITTAKLIQALKRLQSKQLTGKLVITGGKPLLEVWCIYFHLGRIVWATGGQHQTRRWMRSLRHYCPALSTNEWVERAAKIASIETSNQNFGAMQVVAQALQEEVISLNQAKAIVQHHVLEVFFGITNQFCVQSRWVALKDIPQSFVWLYIDPVVQEAMTQSAQWSQLLGENRQYLPIGFSPDFSPTIAQNELLKSRVSASTYQTLVTLLNGQNTFWDIASALNKPLVSVVKSLLPLIQATIIQLQEIPDQPDPSEQFMAQIPDRATPQPQLPPVLPAKPPASKGLIACVDDSPLVGEALETMLKPHGYEVLSILDPLQGVSTLLRHKPRLIFLDLVMPNTNGYELCSFLRKSMIFRNTPIVMLTGRDGVLDRLRAKVAGSNDFLNKPPDEAKVLQVLQKFLGEELPTGQDNQVRLAVNDQLALAQE